MKIINVFAPEIEDAIWLIEFDTSLSIVTVEAIDGTPKIARREPPQDPPPYVIIAEMRSISQLNELLKIYREMGLNKAGKINKKGQGSEKS
ncbi:hypothetical protein ACFL6I_12320 [candidate division KSB1 bacterium]